MRGVRSVDANLPAKVFDGVAFDDFYDRALPVVYGYLLRLCGGDREEAPYQRRRAETVPSLRHGERIMPFTQRCRPTAQARGYPGGEGRAVPVIAGRGLEGRSPRTA